MRARKSLTIRRAGSKATKAGEATMTRIFSYTQPIEADIVDAYCALQKGFTDQFVYYRKDRPVRFMGMGRCIALPALDGIECELEGPVGQQPVFFSFNRFDAENPSPTDELFEAFPRLKFMLPGVILVEDDRGAYLQVNSLSPVYPGRIARKNIAKVRKQSLLEICIHTPVAFGVYEMVKDRKSVV